MNHYTKILLSILIMGNSSMIAQVVGSVYTPATFNLLSIRSNCITPNGNFYFAGEHQSPGSNDVYLSCADSTGNLLWEKVNYCNATDETPFVIDGDDRSIYVAGLLFDTSSNVANAFIMRFRNDGMVAWQYRVNLLNILSLQTTPDGGMVAASLHTTIRIDSSGTILWAYQQQNPDSTLLSYSGVYIDQEGYIYCVGSTSVSTSPFGVVTKFKSSGEIVWSKYYSNGSYHFKNVAGRDDRLYIVGWTDYIAPGFNTFLIELDTGGIFLNGVITDVSDSMTYVPEIIEISPYNTILVSGGQQNLGTMERRGWLAEFDRDSLAVIRTLSQENVTTLIGVAMHPNGMTALSSHLGYSIAGFSWDFGCGFDGDSISTYPATFAENSILLTTETISMIPTSGNVSPVTIPWSECNNSVSFSEVVPIGTLNVVPNPASDICTITFPSPFNKATTFDLTDVNGKMVKNCLLLEGMQKLEINTSDLADGMYFLKSNDGFVTKIVVGH